MSTLVLLLDDRASQHLARALGEHRAWCSRNGVPLPPVLVDLAAALADDGGQSRTVPVAGLVSGVDGSQDDGVSLLSYGQVADLLNLSVRQVGRYVREGRLTRVGRRVTSASVAALTGGAR